LVTIPLAAQAAVLPVAAGMGEEEAMLAQLLAVKLAVTVAQGRVEVRLL